MKTDNARVSALPSRLNREVSTVNLHFMVKVEVEPHVFISHHPLRRNPGSNKPMVQEEVRREEPMWIEFVKDSWKGTAVVVVKEVYPAMLRTIRVGNLEQC